MRQNLVKLLKGFNIESQINALNKLNQYELTEHQFACLLGRSRLYKYLKPEHKKQIPMLPLNDSQISLIANGFYHDPNYCKSEGFRICLWNVYNLFTDAIKTSYIDSFLGRNAGSTDFIMHLKNSFDSGKESWF